MDIPRTDRTITDSLFRMRVIEWFREYCRSQSPVWGRTRAAKELVKYVYVEIQDNASLVEQKASRYYHSLNEILRKNEPGAEMPSSVNLSQNRELFDLISTFFVSQDSSYYSEILIGANLKNVARSMSDLGMSASHFDDDHQKFEMSNQFASCYVFKETTTDDYEFRDIYPDERERPVFSEYIDEVFPYDLLCLRAYDDRSFLVYMASKEGGEVGTNIFIDRALLFPDLNIHQAAVGIFFSQLYSNIHFFGARFDKPGVLKNSEIDSIYEPMTGGGRRVLEVDVINSQIIESSLQVLHNDLCISLVSRADSAHKFLTFKPSSEVTLPNFLEKLIDRDYS